MRLGKVASVLALVVVVVLARQLGPAALGEFGWSFTEDVSSQSVFYRLLAKYQHGDEVIDFDVVVGCNVKVTGYGDNSTSFDAFRAPAVFAMKTKDGGAIWQLIPEACQGHTTENGRVPYDLLPGAIWFDDANDTSLGIAYVTEDAYESPASQLKFLGASIHAATAEEWRAFQPVAAQNLIDPATLIVNAPWPTEDEVKANLWNKHKMAEWWRLTFRCYAIERYELTDPTARAAIRNLWPQSKPRFWMPTYDELETLKQYIAGRAEVSRLPMSDWFHLAYYEAHGFPTRARGGLILSNHKTTQLPPEIFPLSAEDGIPWSGPALATSDTVLRYIDMKDYGKRGFAYCYSLVEGKGAAGDLHMPDRERRYFSTLADGESIFGEGSAAAALQGVPRPFFERDRYLFRFASFDIN